MNKNVAIIDSDLCYARMMSGRLKLYLPEIKVMESTRPSSKHSFGDEPGNLCHADIILYDNKAIDSDALRQNENIPLSSHLIPLRQSSDYMRISASQIYRQIQLLLQDASKTSLHNCSDISQTLGKLIFYLSFCDTQTREKYIKAHSDSFSEKIHSTFRLDLMQGIRMPSFSSNRNTSETRLSSSGINKLLLFPNLSESSMSDLLPYCQPDINGHYSLGRPLRSDDIMNTKLCDLEKIIASIRKNIEQSNQNLNAIVVFDGFTFSALQKLCPIAHEIHIILSDDDQINDSLFRHEIEQLFSKLSPLQKKYVKSFERNCL